MAAFRLKKLALLCLYSLAYFERRQETASDWIMVKEDGVRKVNCRDWPGFLGRVIPVGQCQAFLGGMAPSGLTAGGRTGFGAGQCGC